MTITFLRLQEYLDKIAQKANLDANNSLHGLFWQTTFAKFVAGDVPNKRCAGEPVPIIDKIDPTKSAFYQILQQGWCAMPQMPKTGPFVSDSNYSITLADGTVVTGQQILSDIHAWLAAGSPENG